MSEALPQGWDIATISELTLETSQGAPTEVFRYVDVGGVTRGGEIAVTEEIAPANAPGRARKRIASGDTLFATIRPYMKKIVFVPDVLDGQICSTAFCVLRPNRIAINPRFLYWIARSEAVLDQVLLKMRGVSYPAVSDSEVTAASIPVPPLAEQTRIVEAIEVLLSDLEIAR